MFPENFVSKVIIFFEIIKEKQQKITEAVLCACAEALQTCGGKALSHYEKKCLLLRGESGRDGAVSAFCRLPETTKTEK
ncbi:MAG: hypothetical protein Q4A89_04030 [Tannerella sp.]|nr:hypothetical protein [Tannerella sp.]